MNSTEILYQTSYQIETMSKKVVNDYRIVRSTVVMIAACLLSVLPVSAKTSPILPPVPKILFGGEYQGPNVYKPGPPIPSCNAEAHQGPPDDLLRGCS